MKFVNEVLHGYCIINLFSGILLSGSLFIFVTLFILYALFLVYCNFSRLNYCLRHSARAYWCGRPLLYRGAQSAELITFTPSPLLDSASILGRLNPEVGERRMEWGRMRWIVYLLPFETAIYYSGTCLDSSGLCLTNERPLIVYAILGSRYTSVDKDESCRLRMSQASNFSPHTMDLHVLCSLANFLPIFLLRISCDIEPQARLYSANIHEVVGERMGG